MEQVQSTQQLPQQQPQQAPQEQQQLSPEETKEVEKYVAGLSRILHGKETRNKIYEMLKSMPPDQSIPQVALAVNEKVEQSATKANKKPGPNVLITAAAFLTSELIEIGDAGGFFNPPLDKENPQQLQSIMQNTIQAYLEKGLKDGSVDPVELQMLVEPMLNDQQRNMGLQAAQQGNVPMKPGISTAMESYATKRVGQEQKKMQKAPQGNPMQQAMGGQ